MVTRSGNRAGTKLGRRFEQALLFAHRQHAGQTRKGTPTPYISHLLGVAGLVLEAGGDEDLAIAALLHDVVEDCGGIPMLEEVRRRFGERVAHVVEGCTDTCLDPKPPWRRRKENYVRHLRRADADTHLVSAADKLHNARHTLSDYFQDGEVIWTRFHGKRQGTLWYYRALLREFRRRRPNRLVNELERVVLQLESAVRQEAQRRFRRR
ncbi:MAG TPA: HD domain-containing protein [Terriglobales bacterium]|nr:HD domain-containing protein [Terriglobales bacterium]